MSPPAVFRRGKGALPMSVGPLTPTSAGRRGKQKAPARMPGPARPVIGVHEDAHRPRDIPGAVDRTQPLREVTGWEPAGSSFALPMTRSVVDYRTSLPAQD